MGFLSDELGFESFVGKDFLKNLSKDPKRLVLGVDPLSTKAWNAVLGRHDDPLVDQLGGPYGGHVISAFGKQDGGVYKRAEDAGINTESSKKMQDVAHVVASIYGANGLYGATGGATGSGVTGPIQTGQGLLGGGGGGGGLLGGGGQGLGVFSNGGTGGMAGVGGGNAGTLAAQGGISGGAGMGSATSAAPMGMQDYMKMAQSMGGQQQQPQQQAPAAAPVKGDNSALMAQIHRSARAQYLRKKINRTPQENQELRDLTQSTQASQAGLLA